MDRTSASPATIRDNDKSHDLIGNAGTMGDNVSVPQHIHEIAVAPWMMERSRMQRCESAPVSGTRFRKHRAACAQTDGERYFSSARKARAILRLSIRRAQIKRPGRAVSFGGRSAQPCDPRDIGCGPAVDQHRRLGILRPSRRQHGRSRADYPSAPGNGRAHRVAQGGDAGETSVRPLGPNTWR